jgi:hypothetical protein
MIKLATYINVKPESMASSFSFEACSALKRTTIWKAAGWVVPGSVYHDEFIPIFW